MKLTLVTMAEHATLTQDNKLVIVGTFDSVTFKRQDPKLPIVGAIPMPSFFLVTSLEASISEGLVHTMASRVYDEDGQAVTDALQMGEVRFMLNSLGRPMRFNGLLRIDGLAVPRIGDYEIRIYVDNQHLGEVQFYVVDLTDQA